MASGGTGRLHQRRLYDAPDAIVYADTEGIIRFWNIGAERIFGFSALEAVGCSLDLIVAEDLRQHYWESYREAMCLGVCRYAQGEVLIVPAQRKDGGRISAEFTAVPIRGSDGEMRGMGAVVRDVTGRYEKLERLKAMLAVEVTGPEPKSVKPSTGA